MAYLHAMDSESAFNYAAVLEASQFFFFVSLVFKPAIVLCLILIYPHHHRVWVSFFIPAGQLVQALEMYKRSKEHGFEQTAIHIRNVNRISSTRHRTISVH